MARPAPDVPTRRLPLLTGGDRGRSPGRKLAAQVARRIENDIIVAGWPVGAVLGSEGELLERYGVSRAVFREAVRLVEHKQVARMRRGPGGGLVVTEPSVQTVTDAVTVYFTFKGVRLDEVFEARVALEETVTRLAPTRLSEPNMEELRLLAER